MGRILVIDDDASVREALRWALKEAAHEVTLAADGLEGTRKYKEESADLVITDLFMPGQDGVKTILELRKFDPQVRILAVSGNVLSETVLPIAEKLGAIGILQKPWEIKQLLKAVDTALHAPVPAEKSA